MTTVSVIIPARNAAPWIGNAIRSVAAQTRVAHEIIVVNNASIDDTCAIVRHLRTDLPQLGLISNPRDLGPAASRNVGINQASGEWIALLDADDWFSPTRLRHLTDLGARTGADIVADNQLFVQGQDEPPLRTLFPARDGRIETIGLEAFLRRDRIVKHGNLGLLKPIFRRAFLVSTGLRYDEDPAIIVGEDSLFYVSCLIAGAEILLTHDPLYYYRRVPRSLSACVSAEAIHTLKNKNIALLARLSPGAATGLAGVIERRIADFDDMIAFRKIVAGLRNGDWTGAARHLIANRNRVPFFGRHVMEVLAMRLTDRIRRWYAGARRAPPLSLEVIDAAVQVESTSTRSIASATTTQMYPTAANSFGNTTHYNGQTNGQPWNMTRQDFGGMTT